MYGSQRESIGAQYRFTDTDIAKVLASYFPEIQLLANDSRLHLTSQLIHFFSSPSAQQFISQVSLLLSMVHLVPGKLKGKLGILRIYFDSSLTIFFRFVSWIRAFVIFLMGHNYQSFVVYILFNGWIGV